MVDAKVLAIYRVIEIAKGLKISVKSCRGILLCASAFATLADLG